MAYARCRYCGSTECSDDCWPRYARCCVCQAKCEIEDMEFGELDKYHRNGLCRGCDLEKLSEIQFKS